MGISSWIGIDFVQEVIACIKSIETLIPETDVAIELGGEDAKITFLKMIWIKEWMEAVLVVQEHSLIK